MVFSFSRTAHGDEKSRNIDTVVFERAAFDNLLNAAELAAWSFDEATGDFRQHGNLLAIFGKAFPSTARAELLTQMFFPSNGDDEVDAGVLSAWRSLWEKGAHFDKSFAISRYDGEIVWIRMVVTSRKSGESRLLTGMVREIDVERQAVAAAEAATLRAERAETRLAEEVAELSHEIRTPLNGIIGMSQALVLAETDEDKRSSLETIRTSGHGLMTILDNMVDLSRLESGGMDLDEKPFSIEEMVREALELAAGAARSDAVELSFDVSEDCREGAVGDSDRIRQVLNNLIHNAIRFTDEGYVNIEVVRAEAGKARFVVRDSGPGIAPEDRERIFERFVQTSDTRPGGSGLGLSIARKLVEFMGGEIGVESVVGQGSAFWFDVPLFDGEAARPEGDDAGGDPAVGSDDALRILIAEDDPINQKVFRAALAPLDYEIEIAQNGREALEKLEAGRYDLVLMDINMPVMSGEEAIVQIRASETPWRDVPIIVVTALTNRDSRRYYHSIGANDYLPKPIDVAVLKKKCENLIGVAEARA